MGRNYWVTRDHSAQRSLGIGRDSGSRRNKQEAIRGEGLGAGATWRGAGNTHDSERSHWKRGALRGRGAAGERGGPGRCTTARVAGGGVPSWRRPAPSARPRAGRLLPRPRARPSGPGPARRSVPGLTAPMASCSSAPSRLSMTAARLPVPGRRRRRRRRSSRAQAATRRRGEGGGAPAAPPRRPRPA